MNPFLNVIQFNFAVLNAKYSHQNNLFSAKKKVQKKITSIHQTVVLFFCCILGFAFLNLNNARIQIILLTDVHSVHMADKIIFYSL